MIPNSPQKSIRISFNSNKHFLILAKWFLIQRFMLVTPTVPLNGWSWSPINGPWPTCTNCKIFFFFFEKKEAILDPQHKVQVLMWTTRLAMHWIFESLVITDPQPKVLSNLIGVLEWLHLMHCNSFEREREMCACAWLMALGFWSTVLLFVKQMCGSEWWTWVHSTPEKL